MFKCHVSKNFRGRLFAAAFLSCPMLTAGAGMEKAAPAASVVELMTRDLVGAADKEVVMLTVTYPAAGSSLPHRHDAQVFVYVLAGEVRMQVRGRSPVTLRPGQTFYEAPDDVHVVSANTSRTAPAKLLVIMIKDKGKPGSRSVAD